MTPTGSRPNSGILGYQRLKHDIIRGTYTPGEKLLMNRLKSRYDLGVGPLREALSQLVSERLVVAISQRGYRVASMSIQELRDIYEARAHVEGVILELAIARGGDEWEADILAKSHTLSKVMKVRNSDEMLDVWDLRHKSFHASIASGCQSPYLLQTRDSLFDQAERYRHLWLCHTVFSEDALEKKRQEHAELIEIILSRDATKARKRMYEHLMTPIPIIEKILTERGFN